MPTVIVGPESLQDAKVALTEQAIQNPMHRGIASATTARNVGTGSGVFRNKVGVALNLRSMVGVGGIVITQTADEIMVAGGGAALPVANVELAGDFTQFGVSPAFTTLFSLPLVTTLPASFVWWVFTSTWIHTGAFAGNVAVNFTFRLNGVLLVGGVTDNMTRSQIGSVSRNGRRAVTPATNPQMLDVEVTHFSGPANTIGILPGTQPDLQHAALHMGEEM